MARRGMGKGRGKGYKNLIGKDPKVHSQSAKGIKQPQRIPIGVKSFIQANKDLVKKELEDKTTLDNIEFNDDAVEVVRTKKGMVRIYEDLDPESPREWDNMGKMFFFHGRYDLGDDHPEKSSDFSGWDEIADYLKKEKDAIIMLPVYMYDHSGLRVKIGSFQGYLPQGHAEFDSGMIGYIYVTKDDLKREYGKAGKKEIARARKVLEGEVETYDKYLSGDVWGFKTYNNKGEEIDSCWGFYGMDSAIEEGKASLG